MGFEIPKLTTSCCGCTLRTGSLIVGYSHLLLFTLAVIGYFVEFFLKYTQKMQLFEVEFLENSVLELGLFAGLLFTICFIFGCHTNTPTYMLSFILFQIVNLATSSISLILTIMLHVMGYHLIDTFILIFFMVLQSYYTIVIYNHYQNLREGIIS